MRVLYIEDSISDADLTRRELARRAPGIELEIVSTLQAGLAVLTDGTPFDLLLTDLTLPDGYGLEALTYVREHSMSIAVVVITGSGDQEAAIAAMKAGADDYLVKHGDYLQHLPETLHSAFARFRDIVQLRSRVLRVLYVEHNTFDVDLMRRHLIQHAPHIRLTTVTDAQVALSLLPDTAAGVANFDLLLVDYRLPGMDGLEFTKVLRHLRGLDLPIVLITGQGSEELAAQALHLGIDDYLAKHDGYLYELAATIEKVVRQTELKRERACLKETNQRLKHLLDTSPAILYNLRVEGETLCPVWVSENIIHMFGYTPEDALTPNWWHSHLHEDDRAEAVAKSNTLFTQGRVVHEYRFLRPNGQIVWVRDELRLVVDQHNQPKEVVGTWLDISQRKRTESVQLARNAVLDQIVANQALPTILDDIARRLEAIGEDMYVSIMLLDQHSGLLTNGAAPSLPQFFNDAVEGLEPGENRGSCGTAAWRGEIVIVCDIDNHPSWTPYLQLTQKANLHACWSVPFKDEVGSVLGTFAIYYDTPRSPAPADLELIEEFVRITALAVQKVRATDTLRQSAAVFENIQDGVVITDLTPTIIAINRAYSQITGYNEAEVLGQNPSLLKSGQHDRGFYHAMWASIKMTGNWKGEIWNRRKNGELYPQWLTISTVPDKQGFPRHYVGVFTDISHIKQSEFRLEQLAHYDPLTHLPNRLLVQSHLQHSIERAERYGHRVAVLYIDLDRFKNVNDSLGHPVGDELLTALAQRMSTRLRDEDTLARLGGDEFLLVLEFETQPERAATIAQDFIEMLGTPFNLPSGHELFIGVSIGISLFPDDACTVTELIQHADLAMYQAKQEGRNAYRFHTEALTIAASERLEIETRLRHAFERNEFVLHYQPLFDARDGNPFGLEALVRWQPPGEAMVSPGKFISIAEETGLIVPLGEWVLRTACAQGRAWIDAGLPPLTMAVNLSGRQFKSVDMVTMVRTVLEETDFPAEYLELELTESIVMEQAEKAIATLDGLKALGISLSIDDFGTGYSSLAYLKRFPINKLKIDQSFVRDIVDDANDRQIATTIIAMARNLNFDVLAEGVETLEQFALLQQFGCDQYQGYLFSKPLSADKFEQALPGLFKHGSKLMKQNESPTKTITENFKVS
ncbi:diguanylate cyclase [Methylomonas methanica]|uniref:cyclic-guanylate-specific phosphodiesterase n=1 Tax=Methylomonas methanica TaxID=421 RepID=A0A177M2V8_METMH|nr:EAL domain-containing protein [Methylomonas methanica]OAH99684.1 diguanylate cyclase [Methylomonas methanica]